MKKLLPLSAKMISRLGNLSLGYDVLAGGLALVAFPLWTGLFYLAQLRRDRSDLFRSTGDGP